MNQLEEQAACGLENQDLEVLVPFFVKRFDRGALCMVAEGHSHFGFFELVDERLDHFQEKYPDS